MAMASHVNRGGGWHLAGGGPADEEPGRGGGGRGGCGRRVRSRGRRWARAEAAAGSRRGAEASGGQRWRRRGDPVLIDIPKDIQQQMVVPSWDTPMRLPGYISRLPKPPATNLLDEVIRLVGDAKKPVLYIGGGCSASGDELRCFVELMGIPVTTTLMGIGNFPSNYPPCGCSGCMALCTPTTPTSSSRSACASTTAQFLRSYILFDFQS
uniref:Thiamine pyrophosphate enzyme central domain-containing protein n=1 Tax=Oryza meridionalis TaxID=40149 RepID=A0A0E0FCD2_9ORYZ